VFVHLTACPAWLAITRAEREEFVTRIVQPLLAAHPDVKLRFYDAEFFGAQCSDIITFETTDLTSYAALMDALRDTPLFSVPYFTVNSVTPTTVAHWA
jgi:hypothetical protein